MLIKRIVLFIRIEFRLTATLFYWYMLTTVTTHFSQNDYDLPSPLITYPPSPKITSRDDGVNKDDKSVHPDLIRRVITQKRRCWEHQEQLRSRRAFLVSRNTKFYSAILQRLKKLQKRLGQPQVDMTVDQVRILVDVVFERQSLATVWDFQMRERKLQTQLRQEVLIQQNSYYYHNPENDDRTEREQIETRFLVNLIQNGPTNLISSYFGDLTPSPFYPDAILETPLQRSKKRKYPCGSSNDVKDISPSVPLLEDRKKCIGTDDNESFSLIPIHLNLPFCQFTNAMLVTTAESRRLLAPLCKFKDISTSSPSCPLFEFSFPASLQIFAGNFLDFARSRVGPLQPPSNYFLSMQQRYLSQSSPTTFLPASKVLSSFSASPSSQPSLPLTTHEKGIRINQHSRNIKVEKKEASMIDLRTQNIVPSILTLPPNVVFVMSQ